MDPLPRVPTWPLLRACVVREGSLISLPLLYRHTSPIDQDPTLMTSFNLNYSLKEGLPGGSLALTNEETWEIP